MMMQSAEWNNYEKRLHQLMIANISRRSFIFYSLGSLAGIACSSQLSHASGLSSIALSSSAPIQTVQAMPPLAIPPLFCTAYIDPTIQTQAGQEAIVAKYPLALVPQDMRTQLVRWRDRVKELNPSIVLLAYQLVIEETTVPGPGHDKQRQLSNSWCVYPDGSYPTIEYLKKKLRLFDPRKKEWQDNFVEACRATVISYPYDGLFLDQCTVFGSAHPSAGVRAEMRQALQNTLTMVRKEFPSHILVGNSRYHWNGLNGELNEGRPNNMEELDRFEGHVEPRIQMYHSRLRHSYDIGVLKKEMAKAHARGAFYGAAVNYQHALWFDEFDDVLAEFKRASKKQL
jgi:hypothetical protein